MIYQTDWVLALLLGALPKPGLDGPATLTPKEHMI